MDEDEECLHENSSLNTYLLDLGFSDVQVTKNSKKIHSNKFKVSSANLKMPLIVVDKNVIEQVKIITSSRLLFDEDIAIVENLFSCVSEVVNRGTLETMFQELFGVFALFFSLCLYYIVGYWALVFISPFYAYKCADYLYHKNLVKRQLKRLILILKKNSILLKRCCHHIKEDKIRLLQFTEKGVNFYLYNKFKANFLVCVTEMTNILVNSTQNLIKRIPLSDLVVTPECYLCSNFEKDLRCDDPSKMYLLYIMVQSEFLKRIVFSLIPNLNLSVKNNNNCKKLEEIFREVCASLPKVQKKLEQFFISFNLDFRAGCKLKLPRSVIAPSNQYIEELIFNINNMSKTFLSLELKCRLLEERITSDKIPDNIEAEFVSLLSSLNNCQRNIENSFILIKKTNTVSDDKKQDIVQKEGIAINDCQKNIRNCLLENLDAESDNVKQETVKLQYGETENGDDDSNNVKGGYSDLDYMTEDDVFEIYVNKEAQNTQLITDDWDLEEIFKKKVKAEFSQSVLKELENRLVEKARNWKEREMSILKKKGLIDNNELFNRKVDKVENETKPNKKSVESCYKVNSFEEPKTGSKLDQEKLIEKLFQKKMKVGYLNSENESTFELDNQLKTQHLFEGPTKEFLSDLNKNMMLRFQYPEEEFCLHTTSEESPDDESTK